MKRWHEDYKIMLREWKKHRRNHVEGNKRNSKQRIGLDPQVVDCAEYEEVRRSVQVLDAGESVPPRIQIRVRDGPRIDSVFFDKGVHRAIRAMYVEFFFK